MGRDAVRLVEVRGLPLFPPLLWPRKGIRLRRKSSPFGLKTGLFGLEMEQKKGFAVTNQLTGEKSQAIDSLLVNNGWWVEKWQKSGKRGGVFSVDNEPWSVKAPNFGLCSSLYSARRVENNLQTPAVETPCIA
jgi:hypothetical protein